MTNCQNVTKNKTESKEMDNLKKHILLELLDSSSDDESIIFDTFFGSGSSSEDSAVEEEHTEVNNFMRTIDSYTDNEFKTHLKLQRSTVEYLTLSYARSGFSPLSHHGGKTRLGPRREMYIYIQYIINSMNYRQLGNLFGVPKSSAWIAVRRVCNWLISNSKQYVKWPQGDDVTENGKKFEAKKKIPGVIGAIGSAHVNIAVPKVDKEHYRNRKQNFSIILQTVVDADKKFIDICCGEPGSLHKSRVLQRSALYRRAKSNRSKLFPSNTFILGDSAYPATDWLVTTFKDNGRLTDQQISFNYLHSATWSVVEESLLLLKQRFRRLLNFTEQRDLRGVTNAVASACILHNICIMMNDEYSDDTREEKSEHIESTSEDSLRDESVNRRQILLNHLEEQSVI